MSDEPSLASQTGAHSTLVGVPVDIAATWVLLGTAYALALFYPETPLQFVLGVVLLFVVPGYVTIAAVYPHHDEVPAGMVTARISTRERFALSFALSLVILPLLGLIAAMLPWGVTVPTMFGILGGFIILGGVIAGLRRYRLSPAHRFGIPVGAYVTEFRVSFGRSSAAEKLATVALCCSIVLATAMAGYALAVPPDGESFTDFHLVTETDDGEYVAANYPTEMTEGEPAELTVGIDNHEHEGDEYTVVVTLDRVIETDGEQQVVESVELERIDATVAPGERWRETHSITPNLAGEELRLTYHLYRGDAPDEVTRDTAYRHLHIWVDVEPEDA